MQDERSQAKNSDAKAVAQRLLVKAREVRLQAQRQAGEAGGGDAGAATADTAAPHAAQGDQAPPAGDADAPLRGAHRTGGLPETEFRGGEASLQNGRDPESGPERSPASDGMGASSSRDDTSPASMDAGRSSATGSPSGVPDMPTTSFEDFARRPSGPANPAPQTHDQPERSSDGDAEVARVETGRSSFKEASATFRNGDAAGFGLTVEEPRAPVPGGSHTNGARSQSNGVGHEHVQDRGYDDDRAPSDGARDPERSQASRAYAPPDADAYRGDDRGYDDDYSDEPRPRRSRRSARDRTYEDDDWGGYDAPPDPRWAHYGNRPHPSLMEPPRLEDRVEDFADTIDLRELFMAFRRRLRVCAAIIVAVLAVTVFVTQRMEPRYASTVTLLVDLDQSDLAEVGNIRDNRSLDSNFIDTEIELIRSRAVAARVTESLNLTADPEFNPRLNSDAPRPLIQRLTDLIPGIGGVEPAADLRSSGGELEAYLSREATVNTLTGALDVWREGLSYILQISITTLDPEKSAAIANQYAEAYFQQQIEAKFEETRSASRWLTEREAELADEVRRAEAAVEDFRIQEGLLETGGVRLAETQIAELNAQLVVSRTDLADRQARLSTLNRSGDGAALDILDSEVIRNLRIERAGMSRNLAELSTRYGPLHPARVQAEEELAEIDAGIDLEVRRAAATLENEVRVARRRVADLEANLSERRVELEQNNRALVRLRQLEREAEAARDLYEALLSRSELVSGLESFQDPDARVVTPAIAPNEPTSPNRPLNMAIGLVFALGLAGASVMAMELMESGFRGAADIKRLLGARTLAQIPEAAVGQFNAKTVSSVGDYMSDKFQSSYTEGVKSLRTTLEQFRTDDLPLTVMITSAVPGEGKSTLAFSLARLAALLGDRAVVVDADMRRFSLTRSLPVEPKLGLQDILTGQAVLDQVLVKDEISNLMVLPAVKGPTRLRILRHEHVKRLFVPLRKRFDFIVFDATPAMAVSETRVLARLMDVVVIAARWRSTPRKATQSAYAALVEAEARVGGVALTRVNLRKQALFDGTGRDFYKEYKGYYQD